MPTGNLFVKETDLQTSRPNSVLRFERYYSSQSAPLNSAFGKGWSHTFDIWVKETPDGAKVHWPDGKVDSYTRMANKTYRKPKGVYNDLIMDDKYHFHVITPDKVTYSFDSKYHFNVTKIADLNGILFEFEYDKPFSKLIKVKDRWGDWIKFRYYAYNFIKSIEDSTGRKVRYKCLNKYYAKYLVKVTDVMGRQIKYKYDRKHNLIEKTYSDGVEVITKYDKKHRVIEQGSKKGERLFSFKYNDEARKVEYYEGDKKKKEYYYNKDNKITKVIDALGNYSQSKFDADGNLIEFRDKNGNIRKYKYDNLGNIIESEDPLGGIRRYKYNKRINKLVERVNEIGAVTKYSYDRNGNLEEIINPIGDITKYLWGSYGLPTAIVDPLGNMTGFSYDKKGNVIKVTRYLGADQKDAVVQLYNRDDIGRVILYSDPRGIKTKYKYDQKGRVLEILRKTERGKSIIVRMSYDAFSNVIAIKDIMGNVTEFSYTKGWWRKLSKTTNAVGGKAKNIYDVYGRRIGYINAAGDKTRYKYDPAGRLSAVIMANKSSLEYKYDPEGNLVELTDPRRNKLKYKYDKLNRVIEVTDRNGDKTLKKYDLAGNLIELVDPMGGKESYEYNGINRVTKKINQLGNEISYGYNRMGDLASIGGEGGKISLRYNTAIGKVSEISSGGNDFIRYEYDKSGNRIRILSDDGREINISYDNFNRAKNINAQGKEIEYKYDLNGNITCVSSGKEIKILYEYNKLNKAEQIEYDGKRIALNYDKLGRRIEKTLSNSIVVSYSYDQAGNLIQLEAKDTTNKTIDFFRYVYDASGNRIESESISGKTRYKYDGSNQLTEVEYSNGNREEYFYDGNGNRIKFIRSEKKEGHILKTESRYYFNTLNQMIKEVDKVEGTAGGKKMLYGYSRNGNLVRELCDDKDTVYLYDSGNKLSVVKVNGKEEVQYKYDLFGRRIKKIEGDKTTGYFYDGSNIIMEYDEEGKILSRYIGGKGIDEIFAKVSGDNEEYYIHDGQNSIRAVTDSEGKIVNRFSYSAFGTPRRWPAGTTPRCAFGFTGREFDSATGLYYYRARYYDPKLGRFTQLDPLGMPDGINRYIYARNNPIRWIDPLGLCSTGEGDSFFDWFDDFWSNEAEAAILGGVVLPPSAGQGADPARDTLPNIPSDINLPSISDIIGTIIDIITGFFGEGGNDSADGSGGVQGDAPNSDGSIFGDIFGGDIFLPPDTSGGTVEPSSPPENTPIPPSLPVTIEGPVTEEGPEVYPIDDTSSPRIDEPIYEPPPQDEGVPIEEPTPPMIVEPVPDIPDEQEGVPIDRPSTDDIINKSEKGKGGKEDWNKSDEDKLNRLKRGEEKSDEKIYPKPVSSEKNRDYIYKKVNEINPQQDKYKTKTGRAINNTVKAIGQTMDFADQLRTDK